MKKKWSKGIFLAISEYFAWTDQRLIALLLISRGIDDLDGKNNTEIFTEDSRKCR